jgi:DNA-binding HxlR family transcriptional regulator
MRRTSFEDVNCSVAQCLEVIGDWWTMIVIRDVFMGVNRFDELQARTGISRNVLGERLTRLVDDGVLKKVPYQERPVRYDYRLTDKGRDLWLVLTAMRQWGDKWAAPDGAPVELVHLGCDHRIDVLASCSNCGEVIGPRDVRAVPGPGNDGTLIPQTAAEPVPDSVPVA